MRRLPVRLWAIGAAALVVVVIASTRAATLASGPAQPAAVGAPRLSATDREVLFADRSLIHSLPQAFSEVPAAASDSAGGPSPAVAREQLGHLSALAALNAAIRQPALVSGELIASYDAVLAGRPVRLDENGLARQLETLQVVEGDIVPAVRVIALQRGRHLSAPRALAAVQRDPRAAALADVVRNWQQVYGDFVLVAQATAD